jgi:hypothetical protein
VDAFSTWRKFFHTHRLPFASNLGESEEDALLGERPMSLGFLAIGCLFLVAGIAYLAYLMELPEAYVMGPVLILVGIGAVTGVQNMRRSRI